jgi:putative FmdB family regulatory protein
MPMYEFQCSKCEARFEELVRNSAEEAEIVCPSCETDKIFRVISTFSLGNSSGCHGVPSSCSPPSGVGPGGCGSGGFS